MSETRWPLGEPSDADLHGGSDDERRPTRVLTPRRLALTLAVAAVVAVVALSVVGATGYGCAVCHRATVAPEAQNSGHAGVGCWDCHQDRGPLGLAARPLAVLRMGGARLAWRKPQAPPVDAENCLECHGDQILDTVMGNLVRVRHADFTQSIACESCHGEHRLAPTRPVLDKCAVCHNGLDANNTCDTCHVSPPPDIERSSGWMATVHTTRAAPGHGSASFDTCPMCHASSECARCHEQAQLPHGSGPDWQLAHGEASIGSGDGCLSCHEERECDSCHNLAMPHPAGWLPRHADEADRRRQKLCYTCHDEKNCLSCHTRHVHPYGFSGRGARR